jgi:ketosteroid isomerase-like protein
MTTHDQSAEAVIELSHSAWGEFIKGNPEPAKRLFSRSDDVSVGNPFGPFVRGWSQAEPVMDRAAQNWREGEVVGFELIAKYVTDDLACFVEVERYRAKIGGSVEPASAALRVTTVVRREDHNWKIVCRHADPITSPRPAESVVQT